ncbi:MAG TPA: glycosyltransferase, partial [Steroidobacteraceae bacterium]|nr:glycosyltransferase [Steroidobacteraceae bacterium]
GLWNLAMRGIMNEQRARLGLKPVKNLLRNLMTDRPLLAADSVLGPAPMSDGLEIVQTGAWFFSDPTPLPESLEKFLASGEPPIYFGFGSIPNKTPSQTSKVLIEAARALGRRAIISQGWAGLDSVDDGDDCISIGPVSHEKLFPRVAAIVHHGGAGTTAAAARSGRPQVIVPHLLDQFYWRHRVQALGIGISNVDIKQLNTRALIQALRDCLSEGIKSRAQALMSRIELHGASIAAKRIVREFA